MKIFRYSIKNIAYTLELCLSILTLEHLVDFTIFICDYRFVSDVYLSIYLPPSIIYLHIYIYTSNCPTKQSIYLSIYVSRWAANRGVCWRCTPATSRWPTRPGFGLTSSAHSRVGSLFIQGVQEKLCFFSHFTATPSSATSLYRDLQSSQCNASLQ